jgi:hypothetical protein
MRRRQVIQAVSLGALFLTCVAIVGAASGRRLTITKPVTDVEVFEAIADSFEQLWQGSTVVLKARVVTATPKVFEGESMPLTEAKVEVSSVYKGMGRLGKLRDLTVYQIAGSVEKPDGIIRVAGIEPLHKASEYLIFLGWNRYFNRWMVSGTGGLYEIHNGRLHAYGHSRLGDEREGARLGDVVDELHHLALRDEVHP